VLLQVNGVGCLVDLPGSLGYHRRHRGQRRCTGVEVLRQVRPERVLGLLPALPWHPAPGEGTGIVAHAYGIPGSLVVVAGKDDHLYRVAVDADVEEQTSRNLLQQPIIL